MRGWGGGPDDPPLWDGHLRTPNDGAGDSRGPPPPPFPLSPQLEPFAVGQSPAAAGAAFHEDVGALYPPPESYDPHPAPRQTPPANCGRHGPVPNIVLTGGCCRGAPTPPTTPPHLQPLTPHPPAPHPTTSPPAHLQRPPPPTPSPPPTPQPPPPPPTFTLTSHLQPLPPTLNPPSHPQPPPQPPQPPPHPTSPPTSSPHPQPL